MTEMIPRPLKGMPLGFDYKYLDEDDVLYVRRKTKEIRSLNRDKRSRVYGRDVFAIGSILLNVRSKMPNDDVFEAWRELEAQVTESVAKKYIKITRAFEHAASKLGNVPCTVLYELTFPSYPQSFLEKTLSGLYIPSLEEVRRMRKPQALISTDEIPTKSQEDVIRDISDQIALMQQQLHASPLMEKEKEIEGLQEKVQSLTESYNTTAKDLEAARKSLVEKDNKIAKLSNKLNRLMMSVKQICAD